MPRLSDIYVLSARRTAIGGFGGALSKTAPVDLASHVLDAAVTQADLAPEDIGHVVMGNVIHTEPRDMYLSRVAAIQAGIPKETPALTVNRLCGSGLQAIITAAQSLVMGDADIAIGGGSENMSLSPHATRSVRTGTKMGDGVFTDMMVGALSDPFGHGHMGVTAENVAERYDIDRNRQDALALESNHRASAAQTAGHFEREIVPIEVRGKTGPIVFDQDEHIRHGCEIGDLEKLRPVFKRDGSVTAGNASGINDGAAAAVLANRMGLARTKATPRARLTGYAFAGVDPSEMGVGPIPAVKRLLVDLDMSIDAFDVIESNEAFASQACAVAEQLQFDPARLNPNGGAIALGHPIGATGAILLTKALHELERTKAKNALLTMCIGGGQGVAVALERVD